MCPDREGAASPRFLDNGFAVATEFEVTGGIDNRAVLARPIEPVAAKSAGRAALNDDLRPVAVVLDLVQPARSGGRLRDQNRGHRGEEGKGTQGHGANLGIDSKVSSP
jgi:hypothetical protein